MKPWKKLAHGELYLGHCGRICKALPPKSVHLVVTSPPYWGLRDYKGTAVWVGGNAKCDHVEQTEQRTRSNLAAWSAKNARGGGKATPTAIQYKDVCGKCGAKRKDEQLGSEEVHDCGRWQIPAELREQHPAALQPCRRCFVCHIVRVFRGLRRVLRDDGVAVLNLGDSYGGAAGATGNNNGTGATGLKRDGRPEKSRLKSAQQTKTLGMAMRRKRPLTMPTKNLLGIPWRCALALQADGWVLRSDLPWIRRTAMPESVTDRPAKALEYVFVLAKQPKYYWDAVAIKRKLAGVPHAPGNNKVDASRNDEGRMQKVWGSADGRNFRNADLWLESVEKPYGLLGIDDELVGLDVGTEPLAISHFAAFPTKLVEPFVKAATSQYGCCKSCGACWKRVTKKKQVTRERPNKFTKREGTQGTGNVCANDVAGVAVTTLGWEPSCACKFYTVRSDTPPGILKQLKALGLV